MLRPLFVLFVIMSASTPAFCQVVFPQLPSPITGFSYEDKNWGVDPTASPKRPPYHAPTPTTIPGARVIATLELKALLDHNKAVLVIDVLDSKSRKTIPGALWMPGAGDGQFFAAEKERFAAALAKASDGDKARAIVFLCLSSECWLSYNAALHALEAGHEDVIWYRGGTNSWSGASLELSKPERLDW